MDEPALPAIFTAAARFLDPVELLVLSEDYRRLAECGADRELEIVREEGVSFNPPIARILSILVKDVGVQELCTLRCALYSCALGDPSLYLSTRELVVPVELQDPVRQVFTAPSRVLEIRIVQYALALDFVRHLHLLPISDLERLKALSGCIEPLRIRPVSVRVDLLDCKLAHAITLQVRRLIERGISVSEETLSGGKQMGISALITSASHAGNAQRFRSISERLNALVTFEHSSDKA